MDSRQPRAAYLFETLGDRGGFSQAVFINIVGDIRVGNLAALAEKLNLAPLKKVAEALKQSSVPKE